MHDLNHLDKAGDSFPEKTKTQKKNKHAAYYIAFGIACFFLGLILAGASNPSSLEKDKSKGEEEIAVEQSVFPILAEDEENSCGIVVFALNGFLSTYNDGYEETVSSDTITFGLSGLAEDENIKGVILSVDSGGGVAVAGDEIANSLRALDLPSVAVIRGLGASAAYLAATGADKIFASPFSDVGSIGLTASYLDQTEKDKKDGYSYVELTTGKFKDLGNPSHPLGEEDKSIILSDISKQYEYFIDTVARNRSMPRDKVSELATGQTFVGKDALDFGLIDEIGDIESAHTYLEGTVGEDDLELCWY
jgi:signal peptide peptidase SppA